MAGGVWGGKALTISGVVPGAGGVNQSSSGELALTGINTYWGTTKISNGVLSLGGAQALVALSIDLTGAGAL